MVFNFRVVIISYRRPDTIIEKTLNMLERYGIPSRLIDIWVANREEYEIYKEKVPANLYNKLYIGEKGVNNVRNHVRHHYSDNQLLLNLDDDIEEILLLRNGELTPVGHNLIKLTKLAYKLMKKEGAKLCGLYAVNNTYFMSNTYSTGLYFCVATAYWTINDRDIELDVNLPEKEDYEAVIHHYHKYGGVVRLNNTTIKTNYYKNKGGLYDDRTEERIAKAGQYLIQHYPSLVERNTARNKHFEIKFKRQKNNHRRRYTWLKEEQKQN